MDVFATITPITLADPPEDAPHPLLSDFSSCRDDHTEPPLLDHDNLSGYFYGGFCIIA